MTTRLPFLARFILLGAALASYASAQVGPLLAITTASLPPALVNQPYSVTFTAAGTAPQPYYWILVDCNLPGNFTLDEYSGLLTGVPLQTGTYSLTVTVIDSYEQAEATKTFSVTVANATLEVTPAQLPHAMVGSPFSVTFTVSGGTGQYVFSIAQGTLPQGLSLNSGTGTLSGTPTQAGTSNFVLHVVSGALSTDASYALIIDPAPLSIGTTSLPDGTVGEAYSLQIAASGGYPPYSFSTVDSQPPPGLTLSSNGLLGGTPTAAGSFTFNVRANDSRGGATSVTYTLTVFGALQLAPDTLPSGRVQQTYSASLTVSGGRPPYTLQLIGSSPPGLTLSNGAIAGTPTMAGDFRFSIRAMDSRERTVSRDYVISVTNPISLSASGPLPDGTVGTAYSFMFQATGGIQPYRWSTPSTLPAGLSLNPGTGALSGTPLANGQFTLTIRVADQEGSADSHDFSFKIGLPPLPSTSITQLPATAGPSEQPRFGIQLSGPYPVVVSGRLTLTFTPDSGPDDPAVQFANGSRTLDFTVPIGAQAADFGAGTPALQTGTVAGLITLTATYTAGGTNITPSPAPAQTIRIAPGVPVITRVEINRTSTGFELAVYGFSTPREVTQILVHLTAATGATIAGGDVTIPATSPFATYFNSSDAAIYGSQFRVVVPFTISSGDVSSFGSATVTLVNSQGSSTPVTAGF